MNLQKPMIQNVRPHDGLKPQTFTQAGDRYQADVSVGPSDSPAADAFGRMRTAAPFTIFDSKLINDNGPLFWDDAATSGAGTSSTYNTNQASVSIGVGNLTAGTRVRQTKRRFNYQPGKSHLIVVTFVLGSGAAGITRRVGYFDGQNGIFLQLSGSTLSIVRRSFVTGVAVDTVVQQTDWNVDKMNGSGTSGITLDTTKTQIFFIDMEWLGVGRVRTGFYVNGLPIYAHEFLHANQLSTVYISRPNLPIRYEISNDGTGAASTITHICSTVVVEGGQDDTGFVRAYNMANRAMTAGSAGSAYPLLGLRLKPGYLDITINLIGHSILCSTANDLFCWEWRLNGTTTASLTFSDIADSAVQVAEGTSTVQLTGGAIISSGYGVSNLIASQDVRSHLLLGSTIDGTADKIFLSIIPFASLQVSAAIQWRELV